MRMVNFIFDLYNTLIEVRTDEHREATWQPVAGHFASHGINTDWRTLCKLFDEYWAEFNARAAASVYDYPECDCVEQFRWIARKLGGEFTRAQAAEALCIMRRASVITLRLFDGTVELLDALKAAGAGVYLLSNAQSAFTPDEIDSVGLTDKFDGMLLSSDCGCRKPDKAFFAMLFDKYGIDKASAVMVGDDVTSDGAGAENFGIAYVRADGGAAAHADELLRLAKRI